MLKQETNPKQLPKPPKVIEIILGLILLIFSLAILAYADAVFIVPLKDMTVPNYGHDIGVFWMGSRTVLQGGSPYDSEINSVYYQVAVNSGAPLNPISLFISPFFLTLLFLPLGALPLATASTIWLVVMQCMLVVALVSLILLSDLAAKPKPLLLGLSLALLLRYTFLVMMVGNLSLLLLFAATVGYYCVRTNRHFTAGALTALLLVKPQITILIMVVLLVLPSESPNRLFSRELYRRWLGFGLVSLIFLAYSFILDPNWIHGWLSNVAEIGYANNDLGINRSMTSLRGLLGVFLNNADVLNVAQWIAAIPFWIGLLWLAWRYRFDTAAYPYLFSLVILVNLLTTNYVREYDNALMLFPLLFSFFTLYRLKNWRAGVAFLIAALSYPAHFLTNEEIWGFNTVLTLLIMSYLFWAWEISFKEKKTLKQATKAGLEGRDPLPQ